jgi:protease PrsW
MTMPDLNAVAPSATTTCFGCGATQPATSRFCSACGKDFSLKLHAQSAHLDSGSVVNAAASKVAGMVGLPGLQRFSLGELLSEVFKRRTAVEIEDEFLVGTLRTTPAVTELNTDWPKPWLFARVFLGAMVMYLIFYACFQVFGNIKMIPGLIIVGCFVVPSAALLLLYEFNAPRNVSMMLLVRLVMLGGAMSLLFSLTLFSLGDDLTNLLGASAAGFIEETGKLAAVLFATRKLSPVRYRYTLNGLVFGAAVGAGFAAFESAGYALTIMLNAKSMGPVLDNILLRGVLSPFGHVVWTAIAAGALWRVKGAMSYNGTMLADGRFLRIFIVSVLCHVTWNSHLKLFFPLFVQLLMGLIAWAVALSLVQDGLMQVRQEQQAMA